MSENRQFRLYGWCLNCNEYHVMGRGSFMEITVQSQIMMQTGQTPSTVICDEAWAMEKDIEASEQSVA